SEVLIALPHWLSLICINTHLRASLLFSICFVKSNPAYSLGIGISASESRVGGMSIRLTSLFSSLPPLNPPPLIISGV
ncbi:hypothetical protein OSL55_27915, partial [Escherichia coli]|nr:hypothetical protein [Escherichia coli]